ncbi:hypothetical protein FOZ63_029646 [Perkinsus olseni]|uniref:EF-hand domain-containing protein n=1 Tax=Perkinsus olseni TaxID=32597 RepID=A0A7J6S1Q6_PEROL|nr:hypothetical protein FOZ63_029646 [Perkinsus olseni]
MKQVQLPPPLAGSREPPPDFRKEPPETSEEKAVVPKLPIPMRQVSERNGRAEDPSVLDAFLIPGIQENLFTNEQIAEAFRSIDSDGNGYLDESDLRQVLALSGETVTNEEIQEMIRMVDNNGSGHVKCCLTI